MLRLLCVFFVIVSEMFGAYGKGASPPALVAFLSGVWNVTVTSSPSTTAYGVLNLTKSEDGLSMTGILTVGDHGSFSWSLKQTNNVTYTLSSTLVGKEGRSRGHLVSLPPATLHMMMGVGPHVVAHITGGGSFVCPGPTMWVLTLPADKTGGAVVVVSAVRLETSRSAWWQGGVPIMIGLGGMTFFRTYSSFKKENHRIQMRKIAAEKKDK